MADNNSKKELLERGRQLFDSTRNSSQYCQWLIEARGSFDLYEGNHWSSEEMDVLRARGQSPAVVNKFAPKIDAITGVEIQNRTSIAYRERNFDPKSAEIARAYTYLAAYHQERLDGPTVLSNSFKDMFICGLGWAEVDADGNKVVMEHVDPFEMLWDINDTSPTLTNQQYAIRVKWVAENVAKQKFPKHKKDIEEYANNRPYAGMTDIGGIATGLVPDGTYQTVAGADFTFYDKMQRRVCIVEVQYKELETVWKTVTKAGVYATFLKKSDASRNKAPEATVQEVEELVNKYMFFMDNILLDDGICAVQGSTFSLLPFIYKRGRTDKVPYGLARAARYPQIEYNKRRSKALHLLNTVRVIMDANAVESPTALRMELARPDAIIMKKTGAELEIGDNIRMEQSQVDLMGISSQEMSEVTGINDELQGERGNAISGVGQMRRENASTRTHANAFATLSLNKKRFGEALIYVLNTVYEDETVVPIVKDGKLIEKIKLNAETVDKKNIVNSTQGINFDVYVEEVPEYKAPAQEQAANLTQILMNGQGQFLASPAIAKILGFREPEQVAEAMKSLMPPSQPAEGGAPPPGGQAGSAPSPQ